MRLVRDKHHVYSRSRQSIGIGYRALNARTARTDGDFQRSGHRTFHGKAILQCAGARVLYILYVAVFSLAPNTREVDAVAHALKREGVAWGYTRVAGEAESHLERLGHNKKLALLEARRTFPDNPAVDIYAGGNR